MSSKYMSMFSDAKPAEIRHFLGSTEPHDVSSIIQACMVLCLRVAEMESRIASLEKDLNE